MKNDEIQAEVRKLHLREALLVSQIKELRASKRKLLKEFTENLALHHEETPLEREVKAAKK